MLQIEEGILSWTPARLDLVMITRDSYLLVCIEIDSLTYDAVLKFWGN